LLEYYDKTSVEEKIEDWRKEVEDSSDTSKSSDIFDNDEYIGEDIANLFKEHEEGKD